jgi:hypothetical protein
VLQHRATETRSNTEKTNGSNTRVDFDGRYSAAAVNRKSPNAILESAYQCDLLVEDQIVIEVKAIETVLPVHAAQLLSYLRLMKKPSGLLINFNVPVLTEGVTRRMNGHHSMALHTKHPEPDPHR